MAMHPRFIDDPPLPGTGKVTGVFWNQDRSILAVASAFRLLTEPPARAAYGGHKLRNRVALYRPPLSQPFAVFDDAAFPVNTVAFHPSRPVTLLGGGSYDGGYCFEGELFLWDWSSSQVRDLGRVPEVLYSEIFADGNSARVVVRPWDESLTEEKGGDPFDMHFVIDLPRLFEREAFDDEIAHELDTQTPKSAREFVALAISKRADPELELATAFGISYWRRSPIWDIAWIDANTIGIVDDDCLLRLYGRDGGPQHSFMGEGHGVQILRGHDATFVHLVQFDRNARSWSRDHRTRLAKLRDDKLVDVVALDGRFTFSISKCGALLGRRDRSSERGDGKLDVIVTAGKQSIRKCNLGHYDVFNHFLRVDRAPRLFFVQGTPPSSHERKYVCSVDEDGQIQRLWPLLRNKGDQASHAMECCFVYIQDRLGEGLIASGKHYDSAPGAYHGFVYRKNLDGAELWRHPTRSSAASIKTTPDGRILVVAFLDGSLAVLHGDTGDIAQWDAFKPDSFSTVIVSLDIDETHILFGTLDGRFGVAPVSDLMGSV
jgi:WD40 repeat protein